MPDKQGRQIQLVGNVGKWKHIPIAIGGTAPRRHDLIEFEELTDYDVKTIKSSKSKLNSKTSFKKKPSNKQSKRKKRQQKLRSILLNDADSNSVKTITKKQHLKCKYKPEKQTCNKPKLQLQIKKDHKNPLECLNVEEEISIENDMLEWNGLCVPPVVLKALHKLGFTTPMPIQKKILHAAIVEKRDIIGAAETGSGKTLAFGIPLIHHLLDEKAKIVNKIHPQKTEEEIYFDDDFDDDDLNALVMPDVGKVLPALILTPTRELAMQVTKHLKDIAMYTNIWIIPIVGGMAPQKQMRLLQKKPDIVVATPGRLWDIINTENLPYFSQLHQLKYLVIDEADRMLEKGHFEDLEKLLEAINLEQKNIVKRQTYVFSATLTTTHMTPGRMKYSNVNNSFQSKTNKISQLVKKLSIRNKPHITDLTTEKVLVATLTEGKIICQDTDKDVYLYYFLQSFPGRTLVFANSIDCIFRLVAIFELLECNPLHIHAKMQQRQRLKHLDRFQKRENAVLFASDVAARGLDIPNVSHVIHYQTPHTLETYVHRSGRCARSGKEGYSLLLISPKEMSLYKKLCCQLDKANGIPDFMIDTGYMDAVKKRVNAARQVDNLVHQQKKLRLSNNWFQKAAEAMDIELDDDLVVKERGVHDTNRKIQNSKQYLKSLLCAPIFPRGFTGEFVTQYGEIVRPGLNKNKTPRNRKQTKRK